MAKSLKENQVRVNETCVSVSKNLYNQIREANNGKFLGTANVNKTVTGNVNIEFKENRGQHSVITHLSDNQVTIDRVYMKTVPQGLYECTVERGTVKCKPIKE